jgi:hypothetical protein
MEEGAQGGKARKDEARPCATPGEFRGRNGTGFDRHRESSTVRASGLVRSLNKALRNATPRSFRPETLRDQIAGLRLILCIGPEFELSLHTLQRKESNHDESGST